ncbi:TPA: hypothetical protein ACG4A5_000355 [Salmonella bongori]
MVCEAENQIPTGCQSAVFKLGSEVILHTGMARLQARKKDADILFPHREVAVVGAQPDWQWLEENNLMTQEYEGISTGQRRVDKYRYSRGAKIFLFLLTISTAIALYGLYQILTY